MSFSFFKKGSKGKTPELPTKIQDALKAKQQQTQQTSQRERSGPSYSTPPVQASPEQQTPQKNDQAKANALRQLPAERKKKNEALQQLQQLQQKQLQAASEKQLQEREKQRVEREIRIQFDITLPRDKQMTDQVLETGYKNIFGANKAEIVSGEQTYFMGNSKQTTELSNEGPEENKGLTVIQRPKTTLTLTWDATKEGREKAHAFEAIFDQYLVNSEGKDKLTPVLLAGSKDKSTPDLLVDSRYNERSAPLYTKSAINFSHLENQGKIEVSFAIMKSDANARLVMMNIIDHIKAQVKPSQTVEQSQGKEAQGKEVVEQENRSSPRP